MDNTIQEQNYRAQYALKSGDIIKCKDDVEYTIIGEPIGYGGSSILYAASRSDTCIRFAIKEWFSNDHCMRFERSKGIIQPINIDDGTAIAQLERARKNLENEARISQQLCNTNIRTVPTCEILAPISITTGGKTYTEVSGGIFSVQPQFDIKARSFEDILQEISGSCTPKEKRKTHGLPNIYMTTCFLEEILRALKEIHEARDSENSEMQGWIFGDVSSNNIFFAETDLSKGYPGIATLLDYGSSMPLDHNGETQDLMAKEIFSTKGYQPPEIRDSNGKPLKLSKQSDVYSAGCLMLRCVISSQKIEMYGDSPYVGAEPVDPIDAKAIGCSERVRMMLNRILAKALAAVPKMRYADATAMLIDIQHLKDCCAPILSWENGLTSDILACAAERFYLECKDNNSTLFQSQYIPTLVDSLPVKRLELVGSHNYHSPQPIHQLLEQHRNNLRFLAAPGGAGKTFVLSEVFEKYIFHKHIIPLYLDLADFDFASTLTNPERIVPYMLAKQYLNNTAPQTIDKVTPLLTSNIILILDNCHKIAPERKEVFEIAIKTVHKKSVQVLLAGRESSLPVLQNLKPEVINLCRIPIEQCISAIGTVVGRALNELEKDKLRNQYAVIGLPLFLMRTLEIILWKREANLDCQTAGQLLFEYFNCQLASQPATSDTPSAVSAASTLIHSTIPKMAFWCDTNKKHSYGEKELFEGTRLWDSIESMQNCLSRAETLGILCRTYDSKVAFIHDIYLGYFSALFVYKSLDIAVKEQESYFLKRINSHWCHNTIQFIPDLVECHQKAISNFYKEIHDLLVRNAQHSSIVWNLFRSIRNREKLFRQSACYSELYLSFLQLSISQEVVPSYLAASQLYSDGVLVEKDNEKARCYLTKAADAGLAEAQLQLAEYYFHSNDKAEQELGFEYCSRAADQGDPNAQLRLAEAWCKGEGVAFPDDGQALEWYKKAAHADHPEAQYKYGYSLYWGIGTPSVDDDHEIDAMLYRAACSGHPEAQFMIAYHGLNYWCQNSQSATYWYREAASQGHAKSQYRLAVSIVSDKEYCRYVGFEAARSEAIELLKKSATSGIAAAGHLLHHIFHLGLWGLSEDSAEAEKWGHTAQNNKAKYDQCKTSKNNMDLLYDHLNPHGQYLRGLSELYFHEKNWFFSEYQRAMGWFKLAAHQGHLGARNYLQKYKTTAVQKIDFTAYDVESLSHSLEVLLGLVPPKTVPQKHMQSDTYQVNESNAMPFDELLEYKDRCIGYSKYTSKDDEFFRDAIHFAYEGDMEKWIQYDMERLYALIIEQNK